MFTDMDRFRWVTVVAQHLCEVWGWPEGEKEAVILASNIVFNLETLVASTNTAPETLLRALLPVEKRDELKAPTRETYVLASGGD